MVRLTRDKPERERNEPSHRTSSAASGSREAGSTARTTKPPVPRGLTERQWFITLLVVSGLLLLFTFRGCVLPSGVGPKSKPVAQPQTSATPAAPATNVTEYTVEAGDTLSEIAGKLGTTVPALAQANNIDLENNVILRVGQKLKVPANAP